MSRTGYYLLSEWGKVEIEKKIQDLMRRDRYDSKDALLRGTSFGRSTFYKVIGRKEAVEAKTIEGIVMGLGLDGEDGCFYEASASTALTTAPIPNTVEVIDAEFVREGLKNGIPEAITRQQLEESRLMEDRYEELLAKGYCEEQIDALWAGKTPQEILAGISANKTTP